MSDKSLRILIHSINFSPELISVGKYSGEMAAWLVSHGHEVRVVTAQPYYPHWRISEGYSNTWSRDKGQESTKANPPRSPPEKKRGSLVVYRCPLWVPAKPSGLKRILHLASFSLSSFPIMFRHAFWQPDVVLVVEPPLFCAPQALLIARLSSAGTWLHIQDFEVDAAFNLGILPPGILRTFALCVERFLMSGFDMVSTISINMLKRLVDKGVEPDRCGLFPNWVDTDVIFPMSVPGSMRSELGIAPDKIVAMYSGNIGEKQGLETVLEAACILAGKLHIQFVLCGEGAALQRLKDKYGLPPNVMWLPLQPLEKLNELLNMADIHLLPQRAEAADLVMPSKLTAMLASGRPVLATALPDTQVADVIRGCGVVTPPGDADAFAQALLKLANDIVERQQLGKRARIYALDYLCKRIILGRFEQMLMDVARKTRAEL